MATNFKRVIIAYGSESGNAEQLANKLSKEACFDSVQLKLVELNHIQLGTCMK